MKKNELLLIGTHNDGKFREISKLIKKKIKKISPKSLKIEAPKETGKTFRSNSELKANYFYKKSKLISLSDDSGLEIFVLKKNQEFIQLDGQKGVEVLKKQCLRS